MASKGKDLSNKLLNAYNEIDAALKRATQAAGVSGATEWSLPLTHTLQPPSNVTNHTRALAALFWGWARRDVNDGAALGPPTTHPPMQRRVCQ